MDKVRNKKILLLVIGIIALLAVECAFAFFHTSDSIDNHFQTAEAKVYMNETFASGDTWVPGEEKQKEVRFGNDGTMSSVLRVKFTPVLTRKDGMVDKAAAQSFTLNFSDDFSLNWVQKGDWYYYEKVLSPSQVSEVTLKSVTVSDQVGNDEHGIETDYSNATYEVKVEGELLQASLAAEGAEALKWDMSPTVSGDQVAWK